MVESCKRQALAEHGAVQAQVRRAAEVDERHLAEGRARKQRREAQTANRLQLKKWAPRVGGS